MFGQPFDNRHRQADQPEAALHIRVSIASRDPLSRHEDNQPIFAVNGQ
jgi:hypothetical protein